MDRMAKRIRSSDQYWRRRLGGRLAMLPVFHSEVVKGQHCY